MDEQEILKKAQAGEQITQADIDKLTSEKKKEAYKKAALGSIIGMVLSFIPNLISKFFRK